MTALHVTTPQIGGDGRFAFVPKPRREADRWAVASPDKVPHDANTGRKARSNEPGTWANFDVARAAVEDLSTPYDRLYFASGDGFMFVDLDGCVRDRVVHPDAQALMDEIGGYAEYSPSAHGAHVLAYNPNHDPGDGYRKIKHGAVGRLRV